MERADQAIEAAIRFWVQREEKAQKAYFDLRNRRNKLWNMIQDVCSHDMKKRDSLDRRFLE